MFDDRAFTDTYDLYRPTVETDSAYEQTVTRPDTATSTDNPCLFFPQGRPTFGVGAQGIDIEFDAVMLFPASDTLKPADRDDQPDYVKVNDTFYAVRSVWNAGNRGLYNVALLRESR